MSPVEAKIMAGFSGGARLMADELVEITGESIAEVNTALMMLELQRRIAKQPDGRFEAI
jgi:predicted Rossmann fold nucleotide-binding protein DprA/Smf involved in DNA uptake